MYLAIGRNPHTFPSCINAALSSRDYLELATLVPAPDCTQGQPEQACTAGARGTINPQAPLVQTSSLSDLKTTNLIPVVADENERGRILGSAAITGLQRYIKLRVVPKCTNDCFAKCPPLPVPRSLSLFALVDDRGI